MEFEKPLMQVKTYENSLEMDVYTVLERKKNCKGIIVRIVERCMLCAILVLMYMMVKF